MNKDYYAILGVSKTASKEEIKKAFHTLAHKHHPDKKGDEKKFKEVNEAYQTLGDEKKRAQYDRYGSSGPQGGFGGQSGFQGGFNASDFGEFDFGNMGDIFSDFFGGQGGFSGGARQKRGNDIQVSISISFKESIFGVERKVLVTKTNICTSCKGSRREAGTSERSCTTCKGSGRVQKQERSFFGVINSVRECDDCYGTGKVPEKKCRTCAGSGVGDSREEIVIPVPKGIEHGTTLKMSGRGEAISGGPAGDLYIQVAVEKDTVWQRKGLDLYTEHSIKITESILGATHELDTLYGKETIQIPKGINTGETIVVKGKGVAHRTGTGNMVIVVRVVIPKTVSKKVEALLKDLEKEAL